ncbi:MAG: RrF2 family transcriptional regulator [Myxococcota bacterium]
MHLLAQEEYGLRCLLQVASHRGSQPLTIPEIAEAEGLSPEYTAKLMRALRKGELVMSTRGASGGYRLARPANEITPWEVLQVLGGSFFPESFCDSHPGQRQDCVHTTDCTVRALWQRVETAVRELLERITLEQLLGAERSVLVTLDSEAEVSLPAARTPQA